MKRDTRVAGVLSLRLGGLLAFYVEELGRKRQIALFNVDVIVSAQMSIVVSLFSY